MDRPSSRTLILAASAAAIVILLAAYGNFFHNAFHFDDDHVIVQNPAIRSLSHWPRFFTDVHTFSSRPSNATYRPLVTLSFAIDYAARHSLDPVPFHVTQFLLLLIVAALWGVVCYDLFGRDRPLLALAAATLFAVHTANTETMNFLSSRSELLSAVGFLGALIVFIRWPRLRRRMLYLIPLAIGALAKAPVVIFAGIVILWVRWIERRRWTDAFRAAVPSFTAGIALIVALNAMNAKEWVAGGTSALHYILTQPYVWMHYARLAILPAGLSADTDLEPVAHWYDTNALAGDLFVILLCLAIVRLARTRDTAPIAFGLGWFAVTLLPTSLFPLAEVANEHRLFFPLMGVAAAAVWTLEWIARRWPARQRFAYAAVGLAILAMAYGTRVRNAAWQTEETLWRDVTLKSPRNGRGWMNFGLTQMQSARYAEAKEAFERAAQFSPAYGTLDINRGIVSAALGEHGEAERFFRRALELHPDRDAHFYYARWLLRRGRGPEAAPHLSESARLAPSWVPPRKMALEVAVGRGDYRRARTLAKEIASLDPTDAEATTIAGAGVDTRCRSYRNCFDEGWKATNDGRHLEAANAYRAAVHYENRPLAWNNLGWSLQSLGFRDDAAAAYVLALNADPGFATARNNLDALLRK